MHHKIESRDFSKLGNFALALLKKCEISRIFMKVGVMLLNK